MKYFYYYFLSELKYLFSKHKLEYKLGKKNIFLFMTADYGNLGDVAITLSEINFLKEYFPEYQLIEVPLSYSYNELRFIKKNIKENDIVAIVGGGNMTNRYESFEIIRRTICRKLVNCRFVFFPQTVDYTSDNAGNKSKKQMIHCLNKISKKLIAVREKNSFNYLKNEVSDLYLVPDIVMYNIGKRISDKVKRTEKIGVCLRDDSEINRSNEELNKAFNEIFKNSDKEYFDTHIGDQFINLKNREERLNELIKRIASYKIVLTDRLHCMIFCCITNTPCIVLDNSNHKIKNVYNTWLKSFDNILFADNYKSINKDSINNLFNSKVKKNFKQEFDSFYKNINKMLEINNEEIY